MSITHLLGILIILVAYGLTWYFLLKSKKIVEIIDKKGLGHFKKKKSDRGENNLYDKK